MDDPLVEGFLDLAKTHPVTVRDLIRLGETLMSEWGVSCTNSMGSRYRDSYYLTYFALGLRDYNKDHLDAKVTLDEVAEVIELFEDRVGRRIPAPYLTGEAFYGGLRFFVTPQVMIPRSLILGTLDQVMSEAAWENESVLDLGCGSGSLGILVAQRRPTAQVDLVDISTDALEVARRNVGRFGVSDRVRCVRSDLFASLSGPYSLIVTNLPYVTKAEMERSGTVEQSQEPEIAYIGGHEGMDLLMPLVREAPRFLTKRGILVAETGAQRKADLMERFQEVPFEWRKDAGGRELHVFTLENGYPIPSGAQP